MDSTVLAQSFISSTHITNLHTWLTKHDQEQDGKIAAKIIRELDMTRIVEFAVHSCFQGNETGFPDNIIKAFVFYIEYLATQMTEEDLAGFKATVTAGIGATMERLPQEIQDVLTV